LRRQLEFDINLQPILTVNTLILILHGKDRQNEATIHAHMYVKIYLNFKGLKI